MGGIGSWISDRLGLKEPKVTKPVIDPEKQTLNSDLIKNIQSMLSGWGSQYTSGVNSSGSPFTFRPYSQSKNLQDYGLTADGNGMIKAVNAPNSTALDLYSTSGNLLSSGGYDPAGKALAYEQITRGYDENMNDDIKSLNEMFGKRGILNSSAAMGRIAETRRKYGTAKGNALGQVALADLDKSASAREKDIEQQGTIDLRNWSALQDVLNSGSRAGSGSPFTAQSLADYESSLAKNQKWNNNWATIIDAAGKFFS